jgi:hypothetical protein
MKSTKILTILFTLTILFGFVKQSNALDIRSRELLKLDNTLVQQDGITYSQPTKIYITEVKGYQSKLINDPMSWIKLLYYYSITELKLNDIPYNYLLTEGGDIYEGKLGGVGANTGIADGNNIVLIGYMSSKGMITPRAISSLESIINDITYKYGVKNVTLDTVDLKIVKTENAPSVLQIEPIKNTITSEISNINIEGSGTEHLAYKASIVSVEYPKEVVIGEKLNIKVKIKNENDFTWFADTNYIYISTVDNKESLFSVNGIWDSFSKPMHIDKDFIKAGEELEITFDLLAKNIPGDYKESFNIMKAENLIFENSSFDVEFKVIAGEHKLLQISSPEYGFVNIRECRWYSCKKIEVANEGEVYVIVKEEEGWYEIEYGEGITGWIYQKYAKPL